EPGDLKKSPSEESPPPPPAPPPPPSSGFTPLVAAEYGVTIITSYLRERYRPDFRRGNSIHTAEGEIVPMGVACEVPTTPLLIALAGAIDAPRYSCEGGNVKRDQLPTFFKRWAKTAWGDLLASLPDEDTAELGSSSPAANEFRRLVREALLAEVVLGETIG